MICKKSLSSSGIYHPPSWNGLIVSHIPSHKKTGLYVIIVVFVESQSPQVSNDLRPRIIVGHAVRGFLAADRALGFLFVVDRFLHRSSSPFIRPTQ